MQPHRTAPQRASATAVAVAVVALTGILAATPAADAKQLAVPQVSQLTPERYTNWCWAAASEMVLRYTGNAPGMCSVADWARDRNGWGNDDCCTNGTGAVCNRPNALYGRGGSIENILENWGADSERRSRALTLAELTEAIDDDSPAIVRWGWKAGGGHVVVAYGVNGSTVNVRDPWDGTTTLSYSNLRSTSARTWTHTLTVVPKKVTYVVDDTGSMFDEIASVRSTLLDQIGGFEHEGRFVKYALITYKDTPSFRGSTVDPDEISAWVGGLGASGGGDCPEEGYGALDLAAEKAPDSDIWWMTDADSHGGFLRLLQTRFRLIGAGCTLHSTVLGSCSGGALGTASSQADSRPYGAWAPPLDPRALGNVDAFTAGETLASGTGGLFFAVDSDAIDEATTIVLEEISSTALLRRRRLPAGAHTTEVPVDSSVAALKVVLDVPAGAAGTLHITGPGGTAIVPGDPGVDEIAAGASTLLRLAPPALVPGTYTVESSSDADYTLSASAVSPNAVELAGDTTTGLGVPLDVVLSVPSLTPMTGFAGPGEDGPGGTFELPPVPPLDLPFDPDRLAFFTEAEDGSGRRPLSLFDDGLHGDGAAGDGAFGGTTSFETPGRFRVGAASADGTFVRVTELLVSVSAVEVEGPPDRVAAPASTVDHAFTVTNLGAGDRTFDVGVSSTGGWADTGGVPPSVTLPAGESTTLTVPVTVPPGAPRGDASGLSLTAVATDDPAVTDSAEVVTTAWEGPLLLSLSPASVHTGEVLVLSGSGFGPDPGAGGRGSDSHHVSVGGVRMPDAGVTSWGDDAIELAVPPGTSGGLVHVVAGGVESNPLELVVITAAASLEPAVALNPPGLDHTVTLTLLDGDAAVPGVTVGFAVVSGPNAGTSESAVTDADGQARFTYTGDGGVGVDRIEAAYADPASPTPATAVAEAFWDLDCNFNGVADTCDLECNGFDGACSVVTGCGDSADADENGVPDACVAPSSPVDVPTASGWALALLALLLAGAAWTVLRP